MAKRTALEKAIDSLDADIAVLQTAKARLVAQQVKTTPRRPQAVAKDTKQSA